MIDKDLGCRKICEAHSIEIWHENTKTRNDNLLWISLISCIRG